MPWIDPQILTAQEPPTEKEIRQISEYLARKAKPRFYADENFPANAVSILRTMGARVKTVQETRRTGHPDENHAAFALRNGLVLLTCDRDYLNNRKFPLIHCPAIVVFDFGSGTDQEIRQAYRCLATIFMAPQIYDKWCKIDAQRDGWTASMRYQNGQTSRTRHRLWRGSIQEWMPE